MSTFVITGNDQSEMEIVNFMPFDPTKYEVIDIKEVDAKTGAFEMLMKRLDGSVDEPVHVRIGFYPKTGADGEQFYNVSVRKTNWVQKLDDDLEVVDTRPGSCVVAWTTPYAIVPDPTDLLAEIMNTASFAFPDVTLGEVGIAYLTKLAYGAIALSLADVVRTEAS